MISAHCVLAEAGGWGVRPARSLLEYQAALRNERCGLGWAPPRCRRWPIREPTGVAFGIEGFILSNRQLQHGVGAADQTPLTSDRPRVASIPGRHEPVCSGQTQVCPRAFAADSACDVLRVPGGSSSRGRASWVRACARRQPRTRCTALRLRAEPSPASPDSSRACRSVLGLM